MRRFCAASFTPAARVSTPPLFNLFIGLVKDTSLAASVTVVELFRQAQIVAGDFLEPLWLYSEAAVIYLIICTVLSHYQQKPKRILTALCITTGVHSMITIKNLSKIRG